MCTTFSKSWNWLMHTMRLVLWGLLTFKSFSLHQLRQLNHYILFQGLKRCIRLHPSYLFTTTVAIPPKKLVNVTFLPKISFVIIVKDIMKLFILPSSRNRSNSDYHGKICQHFSMPFNQKPRHLSLPLRLSPPRVILVRMLKKKTQCWQKGGASSPCCSSSNSAKWTQIVEGPIC